MTEQRKSNAIRNMGFICKKNKKDMKVSHQRPPFFTVSVFSFFIMQKHPAPFAQGAFPLEIFCLLFSGRQETFLFHYNVYQSSRYINLFDNISGQFICNDFFAFAIT